MNPTQQQQFDTAFSGLTPAQQSAYKAANPTIGVGGTTQTVNSSGSYAPISSGNLQSNASPYNLPQQTTPKTTDNLAIGTNSVVAGATNDAAYTPPVPQPEGKKSIIDALKGIVPGIQSQGADIAKINEDAGLLQKKQKAVQLSTEVDQMDKAYRDEIANIKSTFSGTTQGLQSELNIAQDRYQNNRANLALVYKVAVEDYQGAQDIANSKIQSLKETNAANLELYKLNIDAINNDLTESEKLTAQANIQAKQKQADSINTAYANVLESLTKSGQKVPASVYSAVDAAAKSPNASAASIYAAAGQYAAQPNTQITQLDNGETVVVDKTTGKIVSNIGGAKQSGTFDVAGLTPEQASDPFIKKLAASSGGKPITDTFAQQLNKGLTVLGQVGLLQSNINGETITTPDGVKVEGMKTGPIVGLLRGKNPWDTKAQTIKAQLNAIIPNLARGVYGEVGVLTDNDIAQYSKTLPNLTSTEDVRNAVLGITVDIIGKSIKRNLEINAANGKDVSGFIDIYTEMQNTRDSIFSQIPGYKGTASNNIDYTKSLDALFSN